MNSVRFRALLMAMAAAFPLAATAQIAPWPSQEVVWYTGEKPGALNVLVIAPASGLGDAEALGARMGADVQAWPLTAFKGNAANKVKLPRVDVLIVANPGFSPPDAVQEMIRAQLDQGRGAVLVQYEGDAPVNPAFFGELPASVDEGPLLSGIVGASDPEVRLYEGKRARLAVISFSTKAPLSHCLVARPPETAPLFPGAYESAMAMPARAVLWAARETKPVQIVDVTIPTRAAPDPSDIPPGIEPVEAELLANLSGNPQLEEFRVRFSQPLDRYYELTALVRYPELGLQSSYKLTLDKGIESYPMQIPIGFHDYVADFLLSDDGVTWDWYSLTGRKAGWPYFNSVKYAATLVSANDTLAVTADIPPHPVTPEPGRVWLRARDSFGRLVALQSRAFAPTGGQITVHADVHGVFAPGLLLDVYAVAGDRPSLSAATIPRSAAAVRSVAVDVPLTTPFVFSARVVPSNEWGMRRHYRQLREAGVQAVTADGAAEFDLTLRSEGLFPPSAVAGRDLAKIDVSTGTADESSFNVWRALLAQSKGIEVIGMELPGSQIAGPDGDAPSAWSAVADAMQSIRGGFDQLIADAELVARGVVRGDEEDLWPEGFEPKRSKFRGEWFEYRLGVSTIIAILSEPDSKPMKLRFSADEHAIRYLPGQSESFAPGKTAVVNVEPGRAAVVTQPPYEISRVLVNTRSAYKPGSPLTIQMELKTRDRLPDRHVFHVSVEPLGSAPIRYYSRTVSGDGGTARVEIPLALDEAPGVYTLRVTDVLTGTSGETEFAVLPR